MSAPILVLVGPTGSGKTAVATALAALAPITIISADARQLYRRLDIGTAKPRGAERQAAPYEGLDLIEPHERFSAGRWARAAEGWIAAAEAAGRYPVVVGGTGFYVRALFAGLFEEPPLDPASRTALQRALRERPVDELMRWAARLDPAFPGGGGRQRAMRAIEMALLTGRPLSTWRAVPVAAPRHRAWTARLVLPRPLLAERIRARAQAMLDAGLVDEVRALRAAGVAADAPGFNAVGYPQVLAHLAGTLSAAQLLEAIATATRQYVKRQETWFRHQLTGPVVSLDATQPAPLLAQAMLRGYRAAIPEAP